jgi:hypothetical protein
MDPELTAPIPGINKSRPDNFPVSIGNRLHRTQKKEVMQTTRIAMSLDIR